jgi:hypothetical protein
MPAASRALILGALLALGAVGARVGDAPPPPPARWPTADGVFAAPGWTTGPSTVQSLNQVAFVSRRYSASIGDGSAVLSVAVSPEAKKVYRAGPEIPFAGSGYSITPAPAGLLGIPTSWSAIVARRGSDSILLITSQGERRGLLGNGPLAWGAAVFDGVVGNRNDYFQATLAVPLTGPNDALAARRALELADRVFGQLARWDAE